jgi:osmotically-inducible protein OsmY
MTQPDAAQEIVAAVRRAFHKEPRLGPRFDLDRITVESDGTLALEGNVARLAEKKLALLRAAAAPGVMALVDRVHVVPVTPVGDRHIRAQLREMFAQDPNFSDLELREDVAAGVLATEFKPVAGSAEGAGGRIDIEVEEGVVTLNGVVSTLVRKRLAGAMAWWIPGVRDVINGIVVDPTEEDGPDQIEEAVRVVLDRNPAVDAAQIRVGARAKVVRLTGLVRSEAMRELAENDAWAVFGVDDVINEIVVRR